jgi:uncharacterized protein (DUF1330 family)
MSRTAAGLIALLVGVAAGCGGFWLGHQSSKVAQSAAAADIAPAAAEKPAYLVVLGEVLDREKFMTEYAAKLPPIYEKYGGVYLAAGREFEVFEGEGDFRSFVISKWPSRDAARAFWTSAEYEQLRRARIEGNWGRFDVFALEGLPEPASVPPMAQEAARRDQPTE